MDAGSRRSVSAAVYQKESKKSNKQTWNKHQWTQSRLGLLLAKTWTIEVWVQNVWELKMSLILPSNIYTILKHFKSFFIHFKYFFCNMILKFEFCNFLEYNCKNTCELFMTQYSGNFHNWILNYTAFQHVLWENRRTMDLKLN